MDERMRFVIRLRDGESMACLCREFGISRKTGYKIFERYEECGLEGLTDRTRRPFRYANQQRRYTSKWITALGLRLEIPESCCLLMVFMHGLAPAKVVFNTKRRSEEHSDCRSAARNLALGLESQ
jgi:Helix-turn-helix domain